LLLESFATLAVKFIVCPWSIVVEPAGERETEITGGGGFPPPPPPPQPHVNPIIESKSASFFTFRLPPENPVDENILAMWLRKIK
jgi:hypothetical protein